MRLKDSLFGLLVIAVIASVSIFLWRFEKSKQRAAFADRIAELGPRRSGGGVPTTNEGLRDAIAAYETAIEQHVKDAAQTGIYWKILATRFQDKAMHMEALDALQQAVRYYPDDPAIHYMTGLSAGHVAKSTHNFPGSEERGGRESYFSLSEDAYLRAIDLDERYAKPRYGLAVLYLFELNRPADAIPHLERCLEISNRDTDVLFLLGRAYYETHRYRDSFDCYERILDLTKDSKRREEALVNRDIVRKLIDG